MLTAKNVDNLKGSSVVLLPMVACIMASEEIYFILWCNTILGKKLRRRLHEQEIDENAQTCRDMRTLMKLFSNVE